MNPNQEYLPEKIPSLQEVTTVYQDVLRYNLEHTRKSTNILHVLDAVIEPGQTFEESANSLKSSLANANIEDGAHGEQAYSIHTNTLQHIGVSLQNSSQLKSSTKLQVGVHKLIPRIDDVESFGHFLSTQTKAIVQSDIKHLDLFTDLLKGFRDQITHGFAPFPANADTTMVEQLMLGGEMALKTFDYINDDLKRLGLDKPVLFTEILENEKPSNHNDQYQKYIKAKQYKSSYEELEHFIKYWGEDLLKQYIRVGTQEKLAEAKYIYPDGEQMNKKLIKLTAYILEMTSAEKESIKQYGIESAKNLLSGVQKTIERMSKEPDAWFTTQENDVLLKSIELDILSTIED